MRVLDCTPAQPAVALDPWLMHEHLTLLGGAIQDCGDPHLADTLAAGGFTHVLVRTAPNAPPTRQTPTASGIMLVRSFPDAQVFAVMAAVPVVATVETHGFYEREASAGRTWWWMGPYGEWRVRNTTAQPVTAALEMDVVSFHQVRRVMASLDTSTPQEIIVDTTGSRHVLGPFLLTPGDHRLTFRALEPATVADTVMKNGDQRALAVRIGDWRWALR